MAEFPNEQILFGLAPDDISDIPGSEANVLVKDWFNVTKQLPGGQPSKIVTIIDGSISPDVADIRVDTEGQAPADDLNIINIEHTNDGMRLSLRAVDSGRQVIVKHNPQALNGVSLVEKADTALSVNGEMVLKREGAYWFEMGTGSLQTVNGIFPDASKNVQLVYSVTQDEWAAILDAESQVPGALYLIKDTLRLFCVQPDGTPIHLNSKYDVGQYEWFEDEQPRPGFVPLLGTVIENFSATYPEMANYLSTTYGAARLVTKAEYDALHVATWHTNADGTKIGWDGIGGVNRFVWDQDADTLQLPDLQGMFQGQVCDSLGVAGVHGDAIRNITGTFYTFGLNASNSSFPLYSSNARNGAFRAGVSGPMDLKAITLNGQTFNGNYGYGFSASYAVPTGPANVPRAWGALACVYLGLPVAAS
jgi:hypothetical protein